MTEVIISVISRDWVFGYTLLVTTSSTCFVVEDISDAQMCELLDGDLAHQNTDGGRP